ncbi:spore cortex formation protein SpoVR/YcgB (stage V sporulation) [Rhodoferax ferrireducens]|uniref:Spore cortex formation protein SpoVR/YcgB (Stage V sporulation) n=1 Tax=Rhodoferax ferrireducens TaxID=192843 RepID=A0ABU2C9Z6_9BURK|nr:SpoVR family protein [Rhodoferax ferrireducens]MDR7378077.1 spore cortex formation protein SpoVR/YcgB (stage V sporulation) [Rhodoferax ferrireducens]
MTKPKSKLLPTGSEWTFEAIQEYDQAIGAVARRYKLDGYPHLLEVISAEQMMDAYASIGMPVYYHHWSFGKHFLATENRYKRGQMGLAYEIVINSDPCIAYLMDENTLPMQALVIAHAAYGHNSFFKGNHLFKQWTSADAIVDYLVFARNYIAQCEERHGVEAVEQLLDACHALSNLGVDRYKRSPRLSLEKETSRLKERADYLQAQVNDLWRTLPPRAEAEENKEERRFPLEPEENLLYFVEKNAPLLEPWQREVVRIVRKIGQYFYPQRQTQVMNEGWATYWHYTLLNTLYDEGRLGDGFMLEFLQSHTNVVYQPPYNSPYFSGINPYALGFAMWRDIRRICEEPTDEDRAWFPDIAGSYWRDTFDFAMQNFKDESFVAQYLSPKLMREFRFFSVLDDDARKTLDIASIHDDSGFRALRQQLSEQYDLGHREPNIQVWNVDLRGDRSLTLRHFAHQRRPLGESSTTVLKHMATLWGFNVRLERQNADGSVSLVAEHQSEKRRRGNGKTLP